MSKGKQIKSTLKYKNVVSTTRPLQLLHMDLFGPSRTRSLRGNVYALVIVDDFSRYTCTFFLVQKSDAFKPFKKYDKQIQNEKSLTIASIRSDHGGEFQNALFEEFYGEHGISHNFSAPRTPQKMEWLKEIIGILWNLLEQCLATQTFQSIFGRMR